jgi:hypothetical protein
MNSFFKFLRKWRMLFIDPSLLMQLCYPSSTSGNYTTSVPYMMHSLLIHSMHDHITYVQRHTVYMHVHIRSLEHSLLQKLMADLLLNKFLPFMKNWRSAAVFARPCHWTVMSQVNLVNTFLSYPHLHISHHLCLCPLSGPLHSYFWPNF